MVVQTLPTYSRTEVATVPRVVSRLAIVLVSVLRHSPFLKVYCRAYIPYGVAKGLKLR